MREQCKQNAVQLLVGDPSAPHLANKDRFPLSTLIVGVLALSLIRCGGGTAGRTAPPAPEPGTLWSAGMETKDLSEWYLPSTGPFGNHGGSEEYSGIAAATISMEFARSGRFSAKLTITTPSSPESGARLFRWQEPRMDNSNSDLYYSVWYYFPEVYTPATFWNVFQWKSNTGVLNDPFFVLNVGNLAGPTGPMFFYLVNSNAGISHSQSPPFVTIPVGRWTRVEAHYVCAGDNTGRVTIWQDGAQIFDLPNVQTRYANGDCAWSVNNYSDGLHPSPTTIYIDEATISRARVGSNSAR